MTFNRERFDAAIEWIEANPKLHNQGAWARQTTCGTAMCLAGTVVYQAGYRFIFEYSGGADRCYDPATGEERTIESAAIELLGGNIYPLGSGRSLFSASNSLDDLIHMAKKIEEDEAR